MIALEISAPDSLEAFDTLRPRARALNGRGDSVAATISWATLDTAILAVLDTTTGKTIVKRPGSAPGRLQARVGNLRSNPLSIRALAAADTLLAAGATLDTVTLSTPDSLSDSLIVELADTVTSPAATLPLAGRPVVYAIVYPSGSDAVTLVTDATVRTLVTVDTVKTNAAGIAAIQARLLPGPTAPPDSAVVTAQARRAVGTTVPGSPVTFVVRFLP